MWLTYVALSLFAVYCLLGIVCMVAWLSGKQ